jgi:2-polyprenyl-3-methyl-5-hydroxy-6-metoxy-1,4-benzoquinol methylase
VRRIGTEASLDETRKYTDPGAQCPICHQGAARRFECHGYWLLECPSCTHQFFDYVAQEGHVSRVYGDSYFNGGGAGYPDYLSEEHLLRERGRWYAKRLARYMPVGRVLDVGAAAGFVLQGFQESGWVAEGLEPNESMARYAREVLGLSVSTTDLMGFQCDHQYDLVAMIQVIAHLVDPRAALSKAWGVIRPAGHLLVETWNSRSYMARLMGSNWHEYSPPSVLHCFSTSSLSRLLAETGFLEIARGRPSKWIGARHAKELLRHKFGDASWTRGIVGLLPDRLRLPYPAEDLAWLLLRKA